jgi:hypothetical protein
MIRLHKILRSGVLLVGALSLLVLPLAVLPQASAENTDTTTETTTETDTPDQSRVQERLRTAEIEAEKTVEQIRERSENTKRTQTQRQLLCQNREQSMNTKITALNSAAKSQLGNLDSAFMKLKAYQSTNNVTVANFADLVNAANTQQQNATNEVAALGSAGVSVDCTSENVAVQLGTIKQSVVAARTALKDYRTALHNILVALAGATQVADTTEGGTE